MTAVACHNCRTTLRHNDIVGCCAHCRRCFSGQGAFDAHQVGPRGPSGHLRCLDPDQTFKADGSPKFAVSHKSKPGEPPVWSLASSGERWWEK